MKRASQWSRVSGKFDISRDPSASTGVAWNNSIWAAQSTHTVSGVGRRWRRAPRWEIQFNAIRKSVRLFIITVRGWMSGGRAHWRCGAPVFSFIVRMQIRSFRKYCVTQPKYKAKTDGRTNGESAYRKQSGREFSRRIIGRGGQNFASTPARECCGWMA